jgi:hypothetical protein
MASSSRTAGVFFQQVAVGPGAQRFQDALVTVVNRQHHRRNRGPTFMDTANALDAVHAWEPDVDQGHVRPSRRAVPWRRTPNGFCQMASLVNTAATSFASYFDHPRADSRFRR